MTPIGFNYRYGLTKVMLTSNALYVWAWRWGWKPLRTFQFCSSREISMVRSLLAKKSIPAPLSMLPNPPPSSWILITCFHRGFRRVERSLCRYTWSNPRTLKLIHEITTEAAEQGSVSIFVISACSDHKLLAQIPDAYWHTVTTIGAWRVLRAYPVF